MRGDRGNPWSYRPTIGDKLANGWRLRAYVPAWHGSDAHLAYVLAESDDGAWCTWVLNLCAGANGTGHGHYYRDRDTAWRDLMKRASTCSPACVTFAEGGEA